jgi:hypothetical protein
VFLAAQVELVRDSHSEIDHLAAVAPGVSVVGLDHVAQSPPFQAE